MQRGRRWQDPEQRLPSTPAQFPEGPGFGPLPKVLRLEFVGLAWKCSNGTPRRKKRVTLSVFLSAKGGVSGYKKAQGKMVDLSGPRKARSAKHFRTSEASK